MLVAPLLPLLPLRFILRFSLSFQRYLTTNGVTVIALAHLFANGAEMSDHGFNQQAADGKQQAANGKQQAADVK